MTEISPSAFWDFFRPGERKRREEFTELRRKVHEQVERETQERIKKNPVPTETELRLGCFVEMLEPQVREAILEFNRKGYSTESSGFWGEDSDKQIIEGFFTIDENTQTRLEPLGCTVTTKVWQRVYPGDKYTEITFHPQEPDLETIKAQWGRVAAVMPDTAHQAAASRCDGSKKFRQTYPRD